MARMLAIIVAALLAAPSLALRPMDMKMPVEHAAKPCHKTQTGLAKITQVHNVENDEMCELCVNFAVQGLNLVANAILNDGVIQGCSAICSAAFPSAKLEREACDLLCDAVGVAGFIEAIEHSDLDFIYFCELIDKTGLNVCPIQDCPSGNPTCAHVAPTLEVTPDRGPQDTQFVFSANVNVTAPTGTGMIRVEYKSANFQGSSDILYMGFPNVGVFNTQVTLDSSTGGPDDNGGDTGPWPQGSYSAQMTVCMGSCPANGDHPHQANFGTALGKFTIAGGVPPSPPSPFAPFGPMPGPTPGPRGSVEVA
jgi:hypothetical protein